MPEPGPLSKAALSRLRHLRLASLQQRTLRGRRMSWTCHGKSNAEMVSALRAAGLVKEERLVEAMQAVDRGAFCPDAAAAYQDAPQPIGYCATISAPHMHASCLELLRDHLAPGNKALDVGSGSGYLTAIFARLLGPQGLAVGVEHIPELAERAAQSARGLGWASELMDAGALTFVAGDGLQGWPAAAPYHAIHVGASAAEIPPALLEQLAPGGRLLLPVGEAGEGQRLTVVDKDAAGRLSGREVLNVSYIPLTSREQQLGRGLRPVPVQ